MGRKGAEGGRKRGKKGKHKQRVRGGPLRRRDARLNASVLLRDLKVKVKVKLLSCV